MPLTESQYADLGEQLTGLPAGDICPSCGDPSPNGEKCQACRESDPRRCYHCNAMLDESPLGDIFSDEDGEDICLACYENDVEPFEILSDDEQEVIGYDWGQWS